MELDKPAGAREGGDDAHEHGDIPAPAPTPAPTSGDMPGMDMPADSSEHGDASEHGDTGGHGDAGGHGTATEPTTERPLVPVLGTFGGGTAAVMLTAGLMRRKDRERLQVRQAARAARRSAK
jgi:ribosomal protein L15